jgi:hypothetical protein
MLDTRISRHFTPLPALLLTTVIIVLLLVPRRDRSQMEAHTTCQLILDQTACLAERCDYVSVEVELGYGVKYTKLAAQSAVHIDGRYDRVVMRDKQLYCVWQVCTAYPDESSCSAPHVRWDVLQDGEQQAICSARELPICSNDDAWYRWQLPLLGAAAYVLFDQWSKGRFNGPIPAGSADIGEWMSADNVVGRQLLLDPLAATACTTAEVVAICSAARKPLHAALRSKVAAPYALHRQLVSASARTKLIACLERAYGVACRNTHDLKLTLSRDELEALIGTEPVNALERIAAAQLTELGAMGECSAHLAFKLRRRAAVSGSEYAVVPFHRDVSLVVVNAALNDDFIGAQLVFASEDGRIHSPVRASGDATAHDCTVVHGVTRLAAGVRYNLYAVYESELAAVAA